MTKIYTRGGDLGETSDYAGQRIPKDHWIIRLNGKIDSLQAAIDFCNHYAPQHAELLSFIQKKLWQTGGEVSLHGTGKNVTDFVTQEDVERIETEIDALLPETPHAFVRFSTPSALWFNEARVRCRDLEVELTPLMRGASVRKEVFVFINRLSDLFYALAYKEEENPSKMRTN